MRWIWSIECLPITVLLMAVQLDVYGSSDLRSISVPYAETAPVIDGNLELVWRDAAAISGFVQEFPDEGEPVSEPTTVYILQDDWALYFGFRCDTPLRHPDAREGNRETREGDYVEIYLDPFRDGQNAYRFSVNAAGVQADAVLSAGGGEENTAWDGVYYAMATALDSAYTVEIAVPWTTIRHRSDQTQWGFNCKRSIPRRDESAYVVPVRRNEGLDFTRFMVLDNLQPPGSRLGLDLYPTAFVRTEDSYGDKSSTLQPAADITYRPSSWMQIQTTFNPDFSQIEADPFALNLSKYDLYFSERRPFFVEGQEFFRPSGGVAGNLMGVFYSRRIGRKLADGSEVPLHAGGRLTAKRQGLEIGVLTALTGSEEYLGWWGPEQEASALFQVERVAWLPSTRAMLGLIHAGRYEADHHNHVVSADGTLKTATFQTSAQVAYSQFDDIADFAVRASAAKHGRSFAVSAGATVIGDDFDVSEIGFVPWSGYRAYSASAGPVFYPGSGPLSYGSVSVGAGAHREYGEDLFSHSYSLSVGVKFRNAWGAGGTIESGREYEFDTDFNPQSYSVFLQTDVSRRAWAIMSYQSSLGYNYYRGYVGRDDYADYYLSWRPSDNAGVYVSGSVWVERDGGGGIEDITCRVRPGVRYALGKNLNMSLYEETPFTRKAGILSLRFGLSFSWNFRPKSWLYLAVNEYQRRNNHRYESAQRVVALKFRHLLSL